MNMLRNYLLLVLLITTSSCVVNSKATSGVSGNDSNRAYYIKGMTCGGCIYHVKKALDEDSKLIKFSEKNVEIGEVTVAFKNNDYKGPETDCLITKSIEGKTGYKVFADKKFTKSSCERKQKEEL
jgi:copper chaperone CopZ